MNDKEKLEAVLEEINGLNDWRVTIDDLEYTADQRELCKDSFEKVSKIFAQNGLDVEKVKIVENRRSEGGGDYDGWEIIYQYNDRYYKLDGWYNSHEGETFDDFELTEVEPVKTEIIVYEPVKQEN